ncbi:DNA polymerase EPSILON CATALYTIC SUBUNIT A [Salix koriyanagi]|uniref:DNA polymerase EPSILON CATALYTIC SUBUNIT A n=1 Tax=Salix koriyanagi TaxID=2511006 RepID=A0A9Q0SKJ5_9ROSI|nr:DNA polymerase EPSILON CATALYTIC SUBUNIT A [Salix koriyanagi]
MGSLMAGWDSPVPDPISVKYRRNRSLTRGEIDAYWRSKKRNRRRSSQGLFPVYPAAVRMARMRIME